MLLDIQKTISLAKTVQAYKSITFNGIENQQNNEVKC